MHLIRAADTWAPNESQPSGREQENAHGCCTFCSWQLLSQIKIPAAGWEILADFSRFPNWLQLVLAVHLSGMGKWAERLSVRTHPTRDRQTRWGSQPLARENASWGLFGKSCLPAVNGWGWTAVCMLMSLLWTALHLVTKVDLMELKGFPE